MIIMLAVKKTTKSSQFYVQYFSFFGSVLWNIKKELVTWKQIIFRLCNKFLPTGSLCQKTIFHNQITTTTKMLHLTQ